MRVLIGLIVARLGFPVIHVASTRVMSPARSYAPAYGTSRTLYPMVCVF